MPSAGSIIEVWDPKKEKVSRCEVLSSEFDLYPGVFVFPEWVVVDEEGDLLVVIFDFQHQEYIKMPPVIESRDLGIRGEFPII